MSKGLQTILMTVAWLAPLMAFPFHIFAFISAGLTTGAPSITLGQSILLGSAPFISLFAVLSVLCLGKITVWRVVLLLVPVLLSLAELLFVMLIWKAG